jgi:hypothetical protein
MPCNDQTSLLLPSELPLLATALGRMRRAMRRPCQTACVATILIAASGCGGSSSPASPTTNAAVSSPPASPTTNAAVIVLNGLTGTVEPITTPGNGWLYRLTYQVRETGGTRGATLVNQHIVLSNGTTADGAFNTMPRVAANSTITVQSTLSVLTTTAAASHVAFSITFTDDGGLSGSSSAEADISPKN